MTLVWTKAAPGDLEQILTFLSERNPRAASKVADRVRATIRSIDAFPTAGRLDLVTGCRERIVPRTPLLVIYTIDDAASHVEIIAIFDMARDPETKRAPIVRP